MLFAFGRCFDSLTHPVVVRCERAAFDGRERPRLRRGELRANQSVIVVVRVDVRVFGRRLPGLALEDIVAADAGRVLAGSRTGNGGQGMRTKRRELGVGVFRRLAADQFFAVGFGRCFRRL